MALAAHRYADFIERTAQMKIGDSITTRTGNTYQVHHSYAFADPGSARSDESDVEVDGYVETHFIVSQAGKGGASIMQCDVWRRVGVEGEANADPFAHEAKLMADALVEAFSGTVASGRQRGVFDVEDFTAPGAPVSTGECMLCINTRGRIGEPEDGPIQLPREGGFHRMVVRFRFMLLQDAAGRAAFYLG